MSSVPWGELSVVGLKGGRIGEGEALWSLLVVDLIGVCAGLGLA